MALTRPLYNKYISEYVMNILLVIHQKEVLFYIYWYDIFRRAYTLEMTS